MFVFLNHHFPFSSVTNYHHCHQQTTTLFNSFQTKVRSYAPELNYFIHATESPKIQDNFKKFQSKSLIGLLY